MICLLDTHLLLWSAESPERLSTKARDLITDPDTTLLFSAVNIWEIAIKFALQKPGFTAEPLAFREDLIEVGYEELFVTSLHAAEVGKLPPLHGDPFDRLLIGQAIAEEITLVTSDRQIARYSGPILKV